MSGGLLVIALKICGSKFQEAKSGSVKICSLVKFQLTIKRGINTVKLSEKYALELNFNSLLSEE
jgi:hypothetical protein